MVGDGAVGQMVGAIAGDVAEQTGGLAQEQVKVLAVNELNKRKQNINRALCMEDEKKMDSKYIERDEWEYDSQQMDKIYIMTGEGMKYICCEKSGKINCGKRGKKGTIFESIPHKTDKLKVALKSNGCYLFIDESKKGKVTTSESVYYFSIVSYSNSKFSFVSQNGYYLYFKKKGGFSQGCQIASKLKKNIK
eukprot:UN11866